MRLFFKNSPCDTVDAVLGEYADDEFSSATRSTVPLLSLLKHGGAVWEGIVREFVPAGAEHDLHLEYAVPSRRGRGKPSYTDAMLVSDGAATALEAKWTESRYEPVRKWLARKTGSSNRRAVLEGWLELLQTHAERDLDLAAFDDVVYQLVHRAASACSACGQAAGAPSLAYLQFSPLPDGKKPAIGRLKADLAQLKRALGNPQGFRFCVVEVGIEPTEAFQRVKNLPEPPKNTKPEDYPVCKALRGAPLFTVRSYKMHSA